MNTVWVLDVACRVLNQVEVLDDFEELLVEVEVLLVEEALLVPEAILKLHTCHSLQQLLVLNLVAFGQHVQMREAQLAHCRDGSQTSCEILAWFADERAISAIHRAEVEACVGNRLTQPGHDVQVRVELNLPRAIEKEEGVVSKLIELIQKLVDVIYQIFHTIN